VAVISAVFCLDPCSSCCTGALCSPVLRPHTWLCVSVVNQYPFICFLLLRLHSYVCLQAGHGASPQALVMVNDCSRAFSSAGDRSIVAWDLQVRACRALLIIPRLSTSPSTWLLGLHGCNNSANAGSRSACFRLVALPDGSHLDLITHTSKYDKTHLCTCRYHYPI
jgi:hypothetical protein